jgi:hypothetical protein
VIKASSGSVISRAPQFSIHRDTLIKLGVLKGKAESGRKINLPGIDTTINFSLVTIQTFHFSNSAHLSKK